MANKKSKPKSPKSSKQSSKSATLFVLPFSPKLEERKSANFQLPAYAGTNLTAGMVCLYMAWPGIIVDPDEYGLPEDVESSKPTRRAVLVRYFGHHGQTWYSWAAFSRIELLTKSDIRKKMHGLRNKNSDLCKAYKEALNVAWTEHPDFLSENKPKRIARVEPSPTSTTSSLTSLEDVSKRVALLPTKRSLAHNSVKKEEGTSSDGSDDKVSSGSTVRSTPSSSSSPNSVAQHSPSKSTNKRKTPSASRIEKQAIEIGHPFSVEIDLLPSQTLEPFHGENEAPLNSEYEIQRLLDKHGDLWGNTATGLRRAGVKDVRWLQWLNKVEWSDFLTRLPSEYIKPLAKQRLLGVLTAICQELPALSQARRKCIFEDEGTESLAIKLNSKLPNLGDETAEALVELGFENGDYLRLLSSQQGQHAFFKQANTLSPLCAYIFATRAVEFSNL